MQSTPTRREFLKQAAVAGSAAVAMSASSYAKVIGANDRIGVGVIGCGERGRGAHMPGAHRWDKELNLEITAVCDVWKVASREAAAMTKDWYGREAAQYASYRELIADKNVDAVMIASCDHQHTTHLKAAADAGKHAYCEKPLSMDIASLNAAYDAVKASGVVVQIGTQLRSLPSMAGARDLYRTGTLGTVGRIEQMRNDPRPYWYSRMKPDVKEEDVDWKEFLLDRPMEPFHPIRYSGWYGYRSFSDGTVPGYGAHFIDLVHFITGAQLPLSAVCMGGTYTWKDENNFDCPDCVQAIWTYPEFQVTYSTNCGNGSGDSFRIFGSQACMDLVDWDHPFVTSEGAGKPDGRKAEKVMVQETAMPDHVQDWLQCIRSGGTPNASMDAGYQHAVAVVLAMRAFDANRRMIFDAEKREIREG